MVDRDLFDAVKASPIAGVVTNPNLPDNPIVAVNDAFCELTGYSRQAAIGRNCRFLSGPDTDPASRKVLARAVGEGRPALTEILNYRRNGDMFRNVVMIAPHFDDHGQLAFFVGSQMDMSEEASLPTLRRQRAREAVARLTPRQREVLRRMALGHRSKQIAGDLTLSEKTVKMHRAGLLANLDVPTSADAIRIAVEADL